ncbi:MAG: DUF4956 domain-containing protein [Gemmataceae bacterium]|nr:DUF4956 domain-containing protein [Gemmataceae bacterium]
MWEWFEEVMSDRSAVPVGVLTIRLVLAFVMGCVVAGVRYVTSGHGQKADRAFLSTLVVLSVLIALVTQVIGDNSARAFSLVGALAIIRFRTVVEDTRDTAFVIYAVVAGMSIGSNYLIGPIVCTPLVFLGAWLFRPRGTDAATMANEGTIVLRLATNRPPNGKLDHVLQQHLGGHRMTGLSTARGGSALDVTYAVKLPAPDKVMALVAELNGIEGVQGVDFRQG